MLTRNQKQGFACIAYTTLMFSLMEIVLKVIGTELNPIQICFSRFLAGGMMLLPFALGKLRKLKQQGTQLTVRDVRYFAFLGLMGMVISMSLYQLATAAANASVVAVLFSSNPLFVMIMAYFFLGETIHKNNVIALLIDILGIIMIIAPWNTDIPFAGVVLTLSSTLLFALYTVLGKRKCAEFGGLVVTCFSFLLGGTELLILACIGHLAYPAAFLTAHGLDKFAMVPLLSGYTLAHLPLVVLTYIFITGLGFASYFTAMEKTSANTAALVFFFKPALAPILAWFLLKEQIPLHMLVGIIMILAGSLLNLNIGKNLIKKSA